MLRQHLPDLHDCLAVQVFDPVVVGPVLPQLVHRLLNGDGAAPVIHAQSQQLLGLGVGEIHRLPVDKHIKPAEGARVDPLFLPRGQKPRPLQGLCDVLLIVGLGQVIVRLHLQGVQGVLLVACQEDHHQVRPDLPQLLRQGKAVHPRHGNIQEGRLHRVLLHVRQGIHRIGKCPRHLDARHVFCLHLKLAQGQPLIIHDYDSHVSSLPFSAVPSAFGNLTVTRVPFPGWLATAREPPASSSTRNRMLARPM